MESHIEYQLHLAKNFKLKQWAKKIMSDYGIEKIEVDWRDNDTIRAFLLNYPNDLERLINQSLTVQGYGRVNN